MGITALLKRCLGRSPSAATTAASDAAAAGVKTDAETDAAVFAEAGRLQQQGHFAEALTHYRNLLRKYPLDFDLLHGAGVAEGQLGHYAQAAALIEQALAVEPEHAAAHRSLGNARRGLGEHERALACYERALQLQPRDADTLASHGALLQALARPQAALASFEALLQVRPADAATRFTCGLLLDALERHEEALAAFDAALAAEPGNPLALANRGAMLLRLKRPADALISFEQALQAMPGQVELLINRATALRELGRLDDALAVLDHVLTHPDNAGNAAAHHNRGQLLLLLKQPAEALASYEEALAAQPEVTDAYIGKADALRELQRHPEALATLETGLCINPDHSALRLRFASALQYLRRYEEALASIDAVLVREPGNVHAHNNRGAVLSALRRPADAIASYSRALAIDPGHAGALFNRGDQAAHDRRHEDAIADWTKLLSSHPDYPYLRGNILRAHMAACAWGDISPLIMQMTEAIRRGEKAVVPFYSASVLGCPDLLKTVASIYTADSFPPLPVTPPFLFSGQRHGRPIRIGYLAGEFRYHAISMMAVEVFERHDKNRFEMVAFDNGWNDGSDLRQRLAAAFPEMVDVSALDDGDAAAAIRRRGIDVLIDLNGYSGRKRTGVLRLRPAPVQVSWLGFPGTMGASYIDYIIGDLVVTPQAHAPYYVEKIARLPNTFFPSDSRRVISNTACKRGGEGLPQTGFVFCSFNDSYKITPEIFDIWMRLLLRVPGSVLWLSSIGSTASENLRARAGARGIAPERLVFAPRLTSSADHLARHQLADLFLDTLPYNAHSTCSDALWAGLPVLTCLGSAFAGRVAASLLHAVGLPELVTQDLAHYEALAFELATHPHKLADLRSRLTHDRLSHPLFDTAHFVRHLENAYLTMFERAVRGEAPTGFDVPPLAVDG